jgi:5-methylcytosine-specific restriction endonuclease McrA
VIGYRICRAVVKRSTRLFLHYLFSSIMTGYRICRAVLESARLYARSSRKSQRPSQYMSRHIPQAVREEVHRRDRGRCVECGSNVRIEYDHILPFSKGGSNTARNIRILCEKCNRSRGGSI